MMLGTVIGPGSIFLMLIGAFNIAFGFPHPQCCSCCYLCPCMLLSQVKPSNHDCPASYHPVCNHHDRSVCWHHSPDLWGLSLSLRILLHLWVFHFCCDTSSSRVLVSSMCHHLLGNNSIYVPFANDLFSLQSEWCLLGDKGSTKKSKWDRSWARGQSGTSSESCP